MRFPKFSIEGVVGIVLEIFVGILDHLHIREAYVVWALFFVGLALITDAVLRGNWASKGTTKDVRIARRALGMVPIVIIFGIFGWWIFFRERSLSPQTITATVISTPAPIITATKPSQPLPPLVAAPVRQKSRTTATPAAAPAVGTVTQTAGDCSAQAANGSTATVGDNCGKKDPYVPVVTYDPDGTKRVTNLSGVDIYDDARWKGEDLVALMKTGNWNEARSKVEEIRKTDAAWPTLDYFSGMVNVETCHIPFGKAEIDKFLARTKDVPDYESARTAAHKFLATEVPIVEQRCPMQPH